MKTIKPYTYTRPHFSGRETLVKKLCIWIKTNKNPKLFYQSMKNNNNIIHNDNPEIKYDYMKMERFGSWSFNDLHIVQKLPTVVVVCNAVQLFKIYIYTYIYHVCLNSKNAGLFSTLGQKGTSTDVGPENAYIWPKNVLKQTQHTLQ